MKKLSALFIYLLAKTSLAAAAPQAVNIFGQNPSVNIYEQGIAQPFTLGSAGARTIGTGLVYEGKWLGVGFTDPRDSNSNRTRTSLIEIKNFDDLQWGISLSHFEGFNTYLGTNTLVDPINYRSDIELYSTRGYFLKNLRDSNYSLGDAIKGINKVSESSWSPFFGGQLSNTFLHGNSSLLPKGYAGGTEITRVNGYTLGAQIGIGGVFEFHDFFAGAQVALGTGLVYSAWNENGHEYNRTTYSFINSSIFDYAIGYSSQNMTLSLFVSSFADSFSTGALNTENLTSNTGLNFTYRFE